MKTAKKSRRNQKHYSIDDFGIKKVSKGGIRVERLEERIVPNVPFPHKHDFFQLMIIVKGSGTHHIDFKQHAVAAQQVFIMKPGQTHSWVMSKSVAGLIVEFNHSSLGNVNQSNDLIESVALLGDSYALTSEKYSSLYAVINLMINEFEKADQHSDIVLQHFLSVLLLQLIQSEKSIPTIKSQTLVSQFKALLEKKFKVEHEVSYYARELGHSSKSFTMKITRALGFGPRIIIQERTLLEAKRYLAYTENTVSEIGYSLGFSDANYFSRFFKAHCDLTPLTFRKKFKIALK